LRFPNVSAQHCQLILVGGYWYVTDLQSRNGVKVNGVRVQEKRLDPGDVLSVANHRYEVQYSPADNGAAGLPPSDSSEGDIFSKSLLERAGLSRAQIPGAQAAEPPQEAHYDITKDDPTPSRKGKDAI
jgi:adenylate cyclase